MQTFLDKASVKNININNPMMIKLPFLDYENGDDNDTSLRLANVVWTNCNSNDRMEVIIVEVAPGKYQDYYYNDYEEYFKKLTYKNDKVAPRVNWEEQNLCSTCPKFFTKKSLAD